MIQKDSGNHIQLQNSVLRNRNMKKKCDADSINNMLKTHLESGRVSSDSIITKVTNIREHRPLFLNIMTVLQQYDAVYFTKQLSHTVQRGLEKATTADCEFYIKEIIAAFKESFTLVSSQIQSHLVWKMISESFQAAIGNTCLGRNGSLHDAQRKICLEKRYYS